MGSGVKTVERKCAVSAILNFTTFPRRFEPGLLHQNFRRGSVKNEIDRTHVHLKMSMSEQIDDLPASEQSKGLTNGDVYLHQG